MREYHVPVEQYGFISLQKPDNEPLSDEEIVEAIDDYYRISSAIKGGEGIPQPEFETFIQKQISGEDNHIETYNKMSQEQQGFVQMIKRLKKRIAYKISKE